VRERYQGRFQTPDQLVDGGVTGSALTLLPGKNGGLSVDRRYRERRFLQGESLDRLLEFGRKPVLALAGVLLPAKARQAVLAVLHDPATGRTQANSVLPGNLNERHILFQERLKDPKAAHGPSTLGLREANKAGS
jgi:hypothetical protein